MKARALFTIFAIIGQLFGQVASAEGQSVDPRKRCKSPAYLFEVVIQKTDPAYPKVAAAHEQFIEEMKKLRMGPNIVASSEPGCQWTISFFEAGKELSPNLGHMHFSQSERLSNYVCGLPSAVKENRNLLKMHLPLCYGLAFVPLDLDEAAPQHAAIRRDLVTLGYLTGYYEWAGDTGDEVFAQELLSAHDQVWYLLEPYFGGHQKGADDAH